MNTNLREKLLALGLAVMVIGLFAAVYATRNRESQYAPVSPFVGCYSNGRDQVRLLATSRLWINGAEAGSYKIVKPVGGKHGYLVEAEGLRLTGGREKPIGAMTGDSGYFWPISDRMIELIFEPDVVLDLTKATSPFC